MKIEQMIAECLRNGAQWARSFQNAKAILRFAELLAEGFEPQDAGRELGLTRVQIVRSMQEIRKHLGPQAA